MADKLVRAGYKVARVEQTETPQQLAIRKQKTARGKKKPQVVNREVCSILTLGTRTFCCLDDENALLNSETNGSGVGPLLAIREVLHEMETDDEVPPVCEYGITLIDAVNGTMTLGQFADDVLRSRMNTLLTAFSPSEILVHSSETSPTLQSLLKAYQTNSRQTTRLESIGKLEESPPSTALDPTHRQMLQRSTSIIKPWHVEETMFELHRKGYYPRGSKTDLKSVSRWPQVLQAVVTGKAHLCLQSLGAALFYLQRNLIDSEIFGMGIVKAYIPPVSSCITPESQDTSIMLQQSQEEQEIGLESIPSPVSAEDSIKNLSLDGTTLHNLEILTNAVDHKPNGSLWSKINFTKTPHGARLLRAWLLRPLFRKADIDRRADAVQELVAGAGAVALNEVRQDILSKIGDLDRLLSRVHSMSGPGGMTSSGNEDLPYLPAERAVLYENATYTKRKVGDFSKLLNGLQKSCSIPDLFADLQVKEGGLLEKVARSTKNGGFFPEMTEELDWYFENFDCVAAAKGEFEPSRGCDPAYDEACDMIERIKEELEEYRQEMCNSELTPRHVAKSSWKYVNTKPDSKDKYLIELPASLQVPSEFVIKGKRGSGLKKVHKYRTSHVAGLVIELERALEVKAKRKAKGLQLIFAKFDSQRYVSFSCSQVNTNFHDLPKSYVKNGILLLPAS
jgi:DNA mismatch repair protein MSH6